ASLLSRTRESPWRSLVHLPPLLVAPDAGGGHSRCLTSVVLFGKPQPAATAHLTGGDAKDGERSFPGVGRGLRSRASARRSYESSGSSGVQPMSRKIISLVA